MLSHVLSKIPAELLQGKFVFCSYVYRIVKTPFICICSVSLVWYIKSLRIFLMQHPLRIWKLNKQKRNSTKVNTILRVRERE